MFSVPVSVKEHNTDQNTLGVYVDIFHVDYQNGMSPNCVATSSSVNKFCCLKWNELNHIA